MKKTYQKLLSLLLCCAAVLSFGSFPARADTEITSAAVTGITVPADGSSPVFSAAVPSGAMYGAEKVQWFLNTSSLTELTAADQFQNGQSYQVHVTLKANAGYVFSAQASGTVNGNSCTTTAGETAGQIKLIYDFAVSSEISHVSVKDLTIPVQGALPDTAFSVGENTYRIHEVTWVYRNPFTGNPRIMGSGETFEGGSQYSVQVVLAAENGSSFAGYVTGTINAETAICSAAGSLDASKYVMLETYYNVEKIQVISDVVLTGITVPEKNMTPDFTADAAPGSGYTVEQVAWRGWKTSENADTYTTMTAKDTFQPGYTYQVAVLVKAEGAFALDSQGNPQVSVMVNGESAGKATAVNGKDPVSYVLTGFVFSIEEEKTPIETVTVTDVVQPVIGKRPANIAKVPHDALYTVEQVVWKRWDIGGSDPVPMDSSESFEPNNDYQFTVILKAKEQAAFVLDQYDRLAISATINENLTNPPAAVEGYDPAEYICISYNFRTAANLITGVEILNVEEPEKGKLPDLKVDIPNTDLYVMESVIWQVRDPKNPNSQFTKMGFSDIFENGKVYQLCVTLAAREDAAFSCSSTDQPQVTVKVNREPAKPASVVEDREPTQCIMVTWEYALDSNVKTVNYVGVDGLSLPIPGENPDTEASAGSGGKYSIHDIVWEGKSGKLDQKDTFRAGESYRVTIVLKANEEAAFAVTEDGKPAVEALLNDKAAEVTTVSGKEAAEYIAITGEFTIYPVISGDGAQWEPGQAGLSFLFSGEMKDFVELTVDDAPVGAQFYDVSQDGITLDSGYLTSLDAGIHQLKAVYTDGLAVTEFEIIGDGSQADADGSGFSWLIWILVLVLIVALLAGAIVLSVFLRKKGWL